MGPRAQIDLRIGGERIVGWGAEMELSGTIAALDPEQRLRTVYTADDEETGAEEWLISSEHGTVRLTLISSMSDADIDDWEGFFGDIERGWRLFMASMRFGFEQANPPTVMSTVDTTRPRSTPLESGTGSVSSSRGPNWSPA